MIGLENLLLPPDFPFALVKEPVHARRPGARRDRGLVKVHGELLAGTARGGGCASGSWAVRLTSRTTAPSSGRVTSRGYSIQSDRRNKLQPKDELPKSPDEADALAMTFAPTGGRANLRWIE